MEKARLIFVRHGQSVGNFNHVLLGHTDLDLSELGYEQARISADALSDEKIDVIYSSDLKRAYNTAVAHANIRNMTVIADKGFREQHLGRMENASVAVLRDANDAEYLVFKNDFGNFHPTGGESTYALGERIYENAIRVARENIGKTILIGCHAAAIRSLFGKLLGFSREQISRELNFPLNASFSIVEYTDGELFPIEYSRDEHIAHTLPYPSEHRIFTTDR